MVYLKKICPICVLVSATWIILLVLRYVGYNVNESLIAMLMGGSAVGISYVLANTLSARDAKWSKLVSIPIAFLAAWQLLQYHFGWFALATILYWLTFLVFKGQTFKGSQGLALGSGSKSPESKALGTNQIESELDKCC